MANWLGDVYRPVRRPTRVVRVGDVEIGGSNPIRIQSMTNTDTMDTAGTVEQAIRLAEAGCEIVRVTAPSIRDAENLREIRKQLRAANVHVPLVADIHFTPNAAMIAAEVVEKVRINPGNYADKKKFEVREYDDSQYEAEIERVRKRFLPLVLRCKENGVAMRIGTNHGSLSDRIMNRFGDTPDGMVASALEFLDVCESENYYDIVFSMKSSNTQVAIQAYRLLAKRLEARRPGEPSYPFHVGVTEAGDAEDGRIKSAIGIGSLLEDGLGDTIRVSLTEDPVREVPVARTIASVAARNRAQPGEALPSIDVASAPIADPFAHARRKTIRLDWGDLAVGADAEIRVELELDEPLDQPLEAAARLALELAALKDIAVESLLVRLPDGGAAGDLDLFCRELASLGYAIPISLRLDLSDALDFEREAARFATESPLARWVGTLSAKTSDAVARSFAIAAAHAGAEVEWSIAGADFEIPGRIAQILRLGAEVSGKPAFFSLDDAQDPPAYRVLVGALADAGLAESPIVLRHRIAGDARRPAGLRGASRVSEESLVAASILMGSLLCDGIGDAISLRPVGVEAGEVVDVGYRILQGARQRTTRTEYISCPSCGRTLFDLEEITARIKSRTDHLRGVKIAVMGCIVNGPGEMADADFGYVGSGVGQVTLYVGQEVVARAVPEAEATDRLVELIREHGQWFEVGEREIA